MNIKTKDGVEVSLLFVARLLASASSKFSVKWTAVIFRFEQFQPLVS